MSDTSSINGFELREKVASLQELLVSRTPQLPMVLFEIHRMIKADPEQVTILTPEEVGAIVKGLQAHTQTTILDAAVKSAKSPAAKAKLGKLSLDDI